MEGRIIHNQGQPGQNFTPPTLTKDMFMKLMDMYWNGAVVFETLQEVNPDLTAVEMKNHFKEVSKEVVYFFNQIIAPPIITPRSWEAIREYYFSLVEFAQQFDMALHTKPDVDAGLKTVRGIAKRVFSSTDNKELHEFFHQNPYQDN